MPLQLLLIAAWGFLLVAVFATSELFSRQLEAQASQFGNLLDPDSEIRYIIEHKRVLVLKEELNTMPKFFYFYGT